MAPQPVEAECPIRVSINGTKEDIEKMLASRWRLPSRNHLALRLKAAPKWMASTSGK